MFTIANDLHYTERGVTVPAGTVVEAERTRFPGLSFYFRHEGRSYIANHTDLVGVDPDDYDLNDDDRAAL